MENKRAILMIMDGWGLGKVKESDAIQNANVPFVSSLYNKYPNTTLITFGEDVGLPEGQMGNSEVGHLNLGAGRIVYQELQRINVDIRDGDFYRNPVLLQSIRYAKASRPSREGATYSPFRVRWTSPGFRARRLGVPKGAPVHFPRR